MPKRASKLTCEEFQSHISELINSDADPEDHPHARACALCRQMVQELKTIAEAARELCPEEWKTINKPN